MYDSFHERVNERAGADRNLADRNLADRMEQLSGVRLAAGQRMELDAVQECRDFLVHALHDFDRACRRGDAPAELDGFALQVSRAARRLEYRTGKVAGRKPKPRTFPQVPRGIPLPDDGGLAAAVRPGAQFVPLDPADQDESTRTYEQMVAALYGDRTCAVKGCRAAPETPAGVYFLFGQLARFLHIEVLGWSGAALNSDCTFIYTGGPREGDTGRARVVLRASDALHDRAAWPGPVAPFSHIVCWRNDVLIRDAAAMGVDVIALERAPEAAIQDWRDGEEAAATHPPMKERASQSEPDPQETPHNPAPLTLLPKGQPDSEPSQSKRTRQKQKRTRIKAAQFAYYLREVERLEQMAAAQLRQQTRKQPRQQPPAANRPDPGPAPPRAGPGIDDDTT